MIKRFAAVIFSAVLITMTVLPMLCVTSNAENQLVDLTPYLNDDRYAVRTYSHPFNSYRENLQTQPFVCNVEIAVYEVDPNREPENWDVLLTQDLTVTCPELPILDYNGIEYHENITYSDRDPDGSGYEPSEYVDHCGCAAYYTFYDERSDAEYSKTSADAYYGYPDNLPCVIQGIYDFDYDSETGKVNYKRLSIKDVTDDNKAYFDASLAAAHGDTSKLEALDKDAYNEFINMDFGEDDGTMKEPTFTLRKGDFGYAEEFVSEYIENSEMGFDYICDCDIERSYNYYYEIPGVPYFYLFLQTYDALEIGHYKEIGPNRGPGYAKFQELCAEMKSVRQGFVPAFDAYRPTAEIGEIKYYGSGSYEVLPENEEEIPTTVTEGEGVDIVVTKDASKKKGEDREGIPTAAIIAVLGGGAALGVGGIAAAGAGAAVLAKKKKKGKSSDNNEPQDNNDQIKSTFEMRVYKEFGDTILTDQEVTVYARIVEITENGVERDRNDLTAMISISSPNYLSVSHEQMSGNYKAAVVYAPSGKPDAVPSTAQVCFRLAGAGGSFTEKVSFNIMNPQIFFFQKNITLAAKYTKKHDLKFSLVGTTNFTSVTAKMRGKDYSVAIRQTLKGDYGLEYTATFTEKTNEELEVGEINQNTLVVNAEYIGPDKKKHKLEEEFYVYRMGMGVMLDISAIGCYFGSDGKPVVNKGHVMLLSWDEKDHKIVRVAASPTWFKVTAVPTNLDRNIYGDVIQEEKNMIDALCVGLTVPENAKIDPEKGLECEIACLNGVLDAPQRIVANVEITAKYNNVEYKTVKEFVQLESQPRRKFTSEAEKKSAVQKDKQIEDGLKSMRAIIVEAGMDKQCHPIIEYIDIMLKNYDVLYGYDEQNITKLQRAYKSVINAHKEQAQSDADALDELSKTFLGKCTIVADYAKQCEDTMGLGKRLMIGVCTFGYSEAALLTCRVYRSVRDSIMESDSSESDLWQWTKATFWGSIDPAIECGTSYLSEYGLPWLKNKFTKWKTGKAPNVTAINKSAKALNGNVDKTVTSKLNAADGKNLFKAGDKSLKAHKEITNAVEDAVKAVKKTALSEADEAFERGVEIGREKLIKLAAAEGDDFAAWAVSVQSDKYAMSALKRMKGDAAVQLRSKFNNFMISKNEEIIDMTRRKIAAQLGCPIEEIQVFKGTAQKLKDLKNGLTTTFDLDVTYQQVKSDGKIFKISQYAAEKFHNESCYMAFNGRPAPNYETAYRYAKGLDHSVVQSTSMENYGSEKVLGAIIDSAKQGEVLTGQEAARAAKTIEYKGMERLSKAAEWLKKAASAETNEVYLSAVKAAQMEKAEGFRQIVKQADYLFSKDVIAMTRGADTAVSKPLRFAIETMRKVGDGALTPDAAEQIIKSRCGMSAEEVCKATGKLLETINQNLTGRVKAPEALRSVATVLRRDSSEDNNT